MSDAKVVRIKHNLLQAIKNWIDFLYLQLEHCPPRRRGYYRIHIKVCIEEIADDGAIEGKFEFEQKGMKEIIPE